MIPPGAVYMNIVPDIQFKVGTVDVGVSIIPIVDAELYLFEKKPSDGQWYIIATQGLGFKNCVDMTLAALQSTNHAASTDADAEAWVQSTNYPIAASTVGPWFIAHVLPAIQKLVNDNYSTTAPAPGGTPANTSLGLFQWMVAHLNVTVGTASISFTPGF